MPARRLLFIINPAAGAGRALRTWRRVESQARLASLTFDSVVTSRPGEAPEIVRQRAGQFEVVVAVGGDGTVMEIAEGLLSSQASSTSLGILPAGTGNDLAANLGLGREPLKRLAGGSVQELDVLRINCQKAGQPITRHALVVAGVGIMGECLLRTNAGMKRLLGRRLAYVLGAVRALWSWRAVPMEVVVDGQLFRDQFLLVSGSNAVQTGGGLRLAPGARMDDGQMNLNLVQALSRLEAMRQLAGLRRGTHVNHPRVRYFQGSRLEVKTEQPCLVAADGEVLGHTPAVVELVPKALKVITGI